MKNLLAITYLLFFLTACGINDQNETVDVNAEFAATVKDIHDVETHIGSAPGEEEFRTNCLTCHSLRYIHMQPAFPRKTWEKTVDKMIKNFGAPIPDSTAKIIVDYLMAVKGKP